MTTGISRRDRNTLRYTMPTELPWEFPCSMIAKSLQPQNTRQQLWAVRKKDSSTRTCMSNTLPAAVKQLFFHDKSAWNKPYFVKRKLFIQLRILYTAPVILFTGNFSDMRSHFIMAGNKCDAMVLWCCWCWWLCRAAQSDLTATVCMVSCH